MTNKAEVKMTERQRAEIRRSKTLRGSKFSISGKLKKGGFAPAPITLRLPPEKRKE